MPLSHEADCVSTCRLAFSDLRMLMKVNLICSPLQHDRRVDVPGLPRTLPGTSWKILNVNLSIRRSLPLIPLTSVPVFFASHYLGSMADEDEWRPVC